MNHEALKPSSSPEIQPSREYEALENSFEELNDKLDYLAGRIHSLYEDADSTVKRIIDEAQEAFEFAAIKAMDNNEPLPSIGGFFAAVEGLPSEYRDGFLECQVVQGKLESVQGELDERIIEKISTVADYAKHLELTIDYDKVVARLPELESSGDHFDNEAFGSGSILTECTLIIAMGRKLSADNLGYYQVKTIENGLVNYKKTWQERGLLKDETTELSESLPDSMSYEQVQTAVSQIDEALSIAAKYKTERLDASAANEIRVLKRLADRIATAEGQLERQDESLHEEIAYNALLIEAFKKPFAEKLKKLKLQVGSFEFDRDSASYLALVEKQRNTDVERAFSQIEIIGLPENLSLKFDENDLRQLLLSSVPPCALASVKRLEFRSLTKKEDVKDTTAGFNVWSPELDGYKIVIADDKFTSLFEQLVQKYPEDIASGVAREEMSKTIVHEFGHSLHQTLPAAALKEWEDNVSQDTQNITAYTERMHSSGHDHRHSEDFADTMMLFMREPEELHLTSPARFYSMRRIFEDFMPLYKDIKQLQDHKIQTDQLLRLLTGETDKDARARYLKRSGVH